MTDEVSQNNAAPVVRPATEGAMKVIDNVTRSLPHDGLSMPDFGDYGDTLVLGRHTGSLSVRYSGLALVSDRGTPEGAARYMERNFGWSAVHLMSVPSGYNCWSYVEKYFTPFQNGPWANAPVFAHHLDRWIESLPMPSSTVPGLVAYFQNTDKRARDIQTPIKPGKFLKKFFADVLTEEEIQALALEWANFYAVRQAVVTQDADEIERVYKGKYNGSCMHFKHAEYSGSEHPARVYAGPDLGIAYIGDTDNADARCLVWPEKKIYYPKWYGDGPRLEAALIAAGYVKGFEHNFNGARIQRIEDEDIDRFVLPYLDTTGHVRDTGDYLVFDDDGGIGARNTNGLSDEPRICDDCDEGMSEDEGTHIEGVGTVCEHCSSNNYFYCDETGDYHANENRANVYSDFEGDISERGMARLVNRGRWFFCDATETNYPYSEFSTVETIEGDTVESGYAETNGFLCEYADEWTLDRSSHVELSDGRVVSRMSFAGDSDLRRWAADEEVSIVGTEDHPDQIEMALAA